jgi:hypothetical protein
MRATLVQPEGIPAQDYPVNVSFPGETEDGPGKLTVYVSDAPVHERAFRSAADMVANGRKLIVVDTIGCFHPVRMSQSARFAALDPTGILKDLHILRADTAAALEVTLQQLDSAYEQFQTRHILISDPLSIFYDSKVSTRDAARVLGRVKSRLESLAASGAKVVVLCHRRPDLRTRSHFVLSLCSSADAAYFRI